MVADATRGVKFVLKTELDSNVSKPFDALNKQVDALQARLNSLKIPAPVAQRMASAHATPTNGSGGAAATAAKADADKQEAIEKASQKRRADAKREYEERERIRAEKTAAETERLNRDTLDQQLKDLKKAQAEREKIAAKNTEAMRKQFEAEKKADESFWSGFSKYGEKVGNERKAKAKKEKEEAERQKRLAEAKAEEAQERLRHRVDATIESVSKLARGFAQLGMIGETDMHRIMDTMLGVQGTIDTVRGGLDTIRPMMPQIMKFMTGRAAGVAGSSAAAATAAHGVGAATAGTGAAGATGVAGAAAAAGTPVGLIIAAAGAVAAAIGSAALTIRAASNHGFMGGFHEGSVGQKYGTGIAETAASFQSAGMGLIGFAEHALFAPYGLNDRQRARREEELNERLFGQGIGAKTDIFGINRLALENRRAERMQKEYEQDKSNREKLDIGQTAAFEHDFGYASQLQQVHESRRARERMMAKNYSPLERPFRGVDENGKEFTRFELFKDEKRARQDLQRSVQDMQALQEEVVKRRASIQLGGIGKNSEFNERTARELVEYEERINALKTQQLEISREIARTGIEGLQQQLELQKQATQATRGSATSIEGNYKGQLSSLGHMLPGKLHTLRRIQDKLKSNQRLNRYELEIAEGSGVRPIVEGARSQAEQIGRERAKEYGIELPERDLAHQARKKLRDLERNETGLTHTIESAKEAAGIGLGAPIKIDAEYQHKIAMEITGANEFNNKLMEEFRAQAVPEIMSAFEEQGTRLAAIVGKDVQARIDRAMAKQNQQGRNLGGL